MTTKKELMLLRQEVKNYKDSMHRTQELLLDFIEHQGYIPVFDTNFSIYTFKKRKKVLPDDVEVTPELI